MTEKYKVIDGFDYQNEPCKLVEYIETEERYSTENDLEANSLCKLLNEQEEEIRRLDHLIKIATSLIEWNTIPQVRREWQKHLSKVGDVDD